MLYLASICPLFESNDLIPFVAITGGLTVAIVAIVVGGITGILKSRGREMTKREIAAYVAEGTIDPDKAIAMLNAGESASDIKKSCC